MIRLSALLVFLCSGLLRSAPLIVHEWGTFTVLQDENGQAIPGINIDDEPVPDFVHRIGGGLIRPAGVPTIASKVPLPNCHPDVVMRLETPVIYFHSPDEKETVVDVEVAFPAGWISEFYPNAEVVAPGLERGRIDRHAAGTLIWRGLRVGGRADGPATDAHVWRAPRAVDAVSVTTPAGETERYLFYRGVACLEAPVRVVRDGEELTMTGPTRVGWLADFRGNGEVAFVPAGPRMPTRPAGHSRKNLSRLRAEMRRELIAEGLYPKEADAMLNTWEESYFQSRGLRLFYLVPREWTDRHLPLKISGETEVTRVMIGRIELVTPEQRATLQRLMSLSAPSRSNLPGGYHLLGRFANALITHEHRRRPSEGSRRWMEVLQLAADGGGAPAESAVSLDDSATVR
jgi:hypothetical protein